MAKEYAKAFYNSRNWIQCKEGYLQTQDYLCERCHSPAKVVHHKTYITPMNINDPTITLSWDNLEALCQDCHNMEHHGGDVMMDGVRFDEGGQLVAWGDTPQSKPLV